MEPEQDRARGRGMSETAIFARYVAAMLRIGQADPDRARAAILARGDQVLAALRDALQPGARDSVRIVALIDMYLQTTLEMLYAASRSEDRLDFAEAEMKAWAVAGALDRAALAAQSKDRDTVFAAMRAAESVLGLNLASS